MSIEIKGVTKSFGSFQALHDIHLSIQAGEFIAILGPSGCGKTTLLRILAGFEQPSDGEVMIEDRIVAGKHSILPPEKRRIGMVFQSFALWPHMNVTEHIRFPIRNHKATPEYIKNQESQHISKILELTGLSHLASRMPHELSGGQKQRVAIARALASEPSLLLMDEPLSSLDAMLRMDMRREIQQVHRRTKSAIVYVTHDQGEALAMADRIVVMKDGRIEQVGTPQQIYLQPESEFVAKFVSKSNLVEGSWEQNRFIPKGSRNVSWSGAHIANYFKSNHMYPVRPDEFQLQKDDAEGIFGEVINVQFQGKEFHYVIHANDHQWEVISPQHFVLHEKVKLNLVSSAELLGV